MTLTLVYPDNDQSGLRLLIDGGSHTVADLLQLWQPLCDDERIYKQFAANQHAACVSCINNCCNTAYVTPDIIAVRKMALQAGLSLPDFAQRWLDADKLALGIPVLPQPCPWLSATGRCEIYEARSLLCRFYLCTPLAGELEQLIYSLTLVGMVATARELGLSTPDAGMSMTSFDRLNLETMFSWKDHPGVEAFLHANSYQEVPLKIFL